MSENVALELKAKAPFLKRTVVRCLVPPIPAPLACLTHFGRNQTELTSWEWHGGEADAEEGCHLGGFEGKNFIFAV